jgi:hypothetical protein
VRIAGWGGSLSSGYTWHIPFKVIQYPPWHRDGYLALCFIQCVSTFSVFTKPCPGNWEYESKLGIISAFKKLMIARRQWLTPVILATQKAEIRRIVL